jgi:hypothetical protein
MGKSTRSNAIIPIAMEFVAFDFDGAQFCIRDNQALGVLCGIEFGV